MSKVVAMRSELLARRLREAVARRGYALLEQKLPTTLASHDASSTPLPIQLTPPREHDSIQLRLE